MVLVYFCQDEAFSNRTRQSASVKEVGGVQAGDCDDGVEPEPVFPFYDGLDVEEEARAVARRVYMRWRIDGMNIVSILETAQ